MTRERGRTGLTAGAILLPSPLLSERGAAFPTKFVLFPAALCKVLPE